MGQPADDLETWAEENQPEKMTDEVVNEDTEFLVMDEPVEDDSETAETTEE